MARLDETARGWAPARFGKGDPDGLKDRIRASRQALSGTLRGTLRGRLRGGGSVEEEDSLKPIDLWQFHHVDGYDTAGGARDYRQMLGAVRDLCLEGVVSKVGLCNASTEHVSIALEVLGPGTLVSVQNKFNFWSGHPRAPPPSLRGCPPPISLSRTCPPSLSPSLS
eukprot:CAMPEP_0172589354 /NCGR_PEP_ID=MMETSP1068-20121228/8120_1 /TAXON_ID=35684 /ORGANISM="Pseudopedinella elastica, Strain CCMP716" /LENGTH=166 /DNA_ID=CAMNT_0013384947 /DNA_START=1016 /DNA_END=1512 /DNA_ORIENTATION=+